MHKPNTFALVTPVSHICWSEAEVCITPGISGGFGGPHSSPLPSSTRCSNYLIPFHSQLFILSLSLPYELWTSPRDHPFHPQLCFLITLMLWHLIFVIPDFVLLIVCIVLSMFICHFLFHWHLDKIFHLAIQSWPFWLLIISFIFQIDTAIKDCYLLTHLFVHSWQPMSTADEFTLACLDDPYDHQEKAAHSGTKFNLLAMILDYNNPNL